MQRSIVKQWIEILIRRRSTVMWVGGVVCAVVALVTIAWPPIYQSEAEILVQANRAQLLISPDLRGSDDPRAVVANPVTEQDMNSELQIVTSMHLVQQALTGISKPSTDSGLGLSLIDVARDVAQLPGAGYRALHQVPTVSARDQWALQLEQNINASVVNRSNVIAVTFRAGDAQWSKQFLSRLLNQYLEYHASISHDPLAEKVFAKQALLLKSKLQNSAEKLRAYQIKTGIGSVTDQKTELVKQLSTLQTQHATSAAELASTQQQVVALDLLKRQTPERIGKETRSVQNLALQQLKPQVMQMRAERAELLSRYQPDSRRIKEINAKLAAAERILKHEDHLEVQEMSTDLNPVWVTLGSNLADAEARVAALRAGQVALEQQVADTHRRIDQVVNDGVEIDRLQSQVDADKEAYMSYLRKAEEARAAEALNANKLLSVSVVKPPTVPLKPVFPILWLNLLAGLCMGAAAGAGLAYWDEQHDPKIYSVESIAAASGIDTIAVLHNET